jgi:hypothetical protein
MAILHEMSKIANHTTHNVARTGNESWWDKGMKNLEVVGRSDVGKWNQSCVKSDVMVSSSVTRATDAMEKVRAPQHGVIEPRW